MKNHIKSELIKERINHLLSTQTTTKTALAHAIGMDVSQLSKLVTYGNIQKPMALSRLGMVLGTAGYKATKRKTGNTQTRGWIVYQRDTDEISDLRRILKD